MLHCFDFIREMSFISVLLRLLLAVICGGAVGIEREYKHRPAGFRTHILICLGAAMTTLTSQFLYLEMNLYTDIARLGAQVIAGIGFIGAGSIIVSKRRRVKGLTTAAGLWTGAIIGLACGAGYVECAVFATAMILIAELLLVKFEYRFARKINDVNLYVEYSDAGCIEQIIHVVRDKHIKLNDLEITRTVGEDDSIRFCAILTMQATKKQIERDIIENVTALENIISIEEL